MTIPPSRTVALEGAANVRDLGGLPTSDGGVVRRGRVFRSDVLYRLTESDTVALAALGIRTVIDLRSAYEVLHYPQTSLQIAGLQHVNVPIWSETYSESGSIPEDYLILLRTAGPGFREIFGHLTNDPYPLIINCFAGKDRTGLTTALILGALGVPDDVIVADYALSGQHMLRHMHIHGTTDDATVGRGRLPSWLEATPETMETTLQAITAEWGSMRGYLASIGILDGELGRIARTLVEAAHQESAGNDVQLA